MADYEIKPLGISPERIQEVLDHSGIKFTPFVTQDDLERLVELKVHEALAAKDQDQRPANSIAIKSERGGFTIDPPVLVHGERQRSMVRSISVDIGVGRPADVTVTTVATDLLLYLSEVRLHLSTEDGRRVRAVELEDGERIEFSRLLRSLR